MAKKMDIRTYRKMKKELMRVKLDGIPCQDFIYAEYMGSENYPELDNEKAGLQYYNYLNEKYSRTLALDQPWTAKLFEDIKQSPIIALMMLTDLRPFDALELKAKQLMYTEPFFERIVASAYYNKQKGLSYVPKLFTSEHIGPRTPESCLLELDHMYNEVRQFLNRPDLRVMVCHPNAAINHDYVDSDDEDSGTVVQDKS